MTIVLHFGVNDIPYAHHQPAGSRRVAVRVRRGQVPKAISAPAHGAETTGDVAEWLEEKYHVIEIFYEEIGHDLMAKALEHSLQGAIMDVMMGKPHDLVAPFKTAEDEVRAAFQFFIEQKEMDGHAPGVPTLAALKGINHRLKHPYAKSNPSRPSFDDTGTYMQAFRMEVEVKD